ncbi:MAG: hypothetical protein FJY19_07720 [Bacteroidetes bacterium]|nr:hypothetical protein [Bacteroidota bacterium]
MCHLKQLSYVILTVSLGFLIQSSSVNAKTLSPKRAHSYVALKNLILKASLPNGLGLRALDSPVFKAKGADIALAGTADNKTVQHSETNVQVNGVDEGDIIKTDGYYIYQLANNGIRIVKSYPISELSLVSEIKLDEGFYANELYVQDDRLVVIGTIYKTSQSEANVSKLYLTYFAGEEKTVARVYNLNDRSHPVQERQIELDGGTLSSRKIGNTLYLISRTWPRYYFMRAMVIGSPDQTKIANPAYLLWQLQTKNSLLPHISDSAVSKGKERLAPLNKIYYFPKFTDPNYLTVASFDLSAPGKAANMTVFYGSGDLVYASLENLYISAADYQSTTTDNAVESTSSTNIYKFSLNSGNPLFSKSANVPGTLLNQFSMDENQTYFRVATTEWIWDGKTSQNLSSNNLFTLDQNMKLTGRLENLAPGEQIYSTRFIGDRCYMVTFKQVDPLFVIDLSNPIKPQVLGSLKIPGFSNYLHPFDETHIIGFGRDTVDQGNFTAVDGLKLALFDVSDVSNPTLMHSLVLGGKGSYSEVLYNHKALLTQKSNDPNTMLLGFPLQLYSKTKDDQNIWAWGQLTFEGANIYELSLQNGFTLKKEITHQINTPVDSNDYGWWDYNLGIQRLLTIEDKLFSFSNNRIQVNNLSSFDELNAIELSEL